MSPDLAKAIEFFDRNAGAVRGDDVIPPGYFSAKQLTLAKGLSAGSRVHIKSQWDQMVAAGYADRRILKIGRSHTAYYKVRE